MARKTDTRDRIVAALTPGPLPTRELARRVGRQHNTVRSVLYKAEGTVFVRVGLSDFNGRTKRQTLWGLRC